MRGEKREVFGEKTKGDVQSVRKLRRDVTGDNGEVLAF